jgi:asparagine synthase (glutamine-hydrolysing)
MPGIVGLLTKMPRERAERELRRMVEVLHHEAFYETGCWTQDSLGAYVGWCAQKNSFAGGMPLSNARGDITLVFSGEDFSEPGTARSPEERGPRPDAVTLSHLVPLYEEDASFPKGLNGRFHGLLTDQTRGTATLFNDRYGMQRIYYHESKDAFYFSAEAKAILAVRPELRELDARGLGEFLACGCVLENRTIFRGIQVLPPASAWVFRGGAIQKRSTYFQPREWEEQTPLEAEAFYQELREVFSRNLPRYFNGRERIGMSLTGGLDTRMIMAWRKAAPQSLPCYTFGGMFRDCQDVLVARQVAKICEQSHSVIRVGTEFLSHFPHYAERSVYLTDGCVDLSRSPDLYVSEKAREIAPVKVVGTYASELLNQVPTFKPVEPAAGLFKPELVTHVRQAEVTYAELRQGHPVTFAAFRQSPWWHYGVLGLEQTQLTVRSPYLDNDFVRTIFRAPMSARANDDVRLRLIGDGSPALRGIRTDRGVGGGKAGNPFEAATRAVLEFTFRAEHAYDYAMPQWLARIDHLLSPFHPERIFLGRHKQFHFRIWYRDVLARYVQEMLLDPRTLSRPYLERTGLEAVVRGHLKGHRNYTTEIHKVLTLELLHRLFVDGPLRDTR